MTAMFERYCLRNRKDPWINGIGAGVLWLAGTFAMSQVKEQPEGLGLWIGLGFAGLVVCAILHVLLVGWGVQKNVVQIKETYPPAPGERLILQQHNDGGADLVSATIRRVGDIYREVVLPEDDFALQSKIRVWIDRIEIIVPVSLKVFVDATGWSADEVRDHLVDGVTVEDLMQGRLDEVVTAILRAELEEVSRGYFEGKYPEAKLLNELLGHLQVPASPFSNVVSGELSLGTPSVSAKIVAVG